MHCGYFEVDETPAFEYKWAPQGYWIVDGREHPLEAVFAHLPVPGKWQFSMLTKLEQGDSIPPHSDKPLAEGLTRYHFVLSTDPHSWCMHDGEWQQLQAGSFYTMEPTRTHAAINWGNTPRIHLVVDTK